MDLTKYSIQVLQDLHHLTLPTLGKFELIFESVKLDPQTHKTRPPGYQLFFSQQHNLNDDQIIQEIVRSESRNTEEVRTEVTQTISSWKNNLKTTGILTLEGWGTFTSNKEKIVFQLAGDCILNFAYFGLPVI